MGVDEWDLIWRLGLALALSSAIGLERELRQKSAGLRTYTLVGLGSALFMVISKYGFFDVLDPETVVLDPSRVAAQIVSGIGFIGAGLIFVRRDSVRGLTTAAGVWLTAAVGAACGASLPVVAIATTAAYFVVVFGLAPLARRLPASPYAPSAVRVVYEDGRGILRRILSACTSRDFKGADVHVDRHEGEVESPATAPVAVSLEIHGSGSVASLAVELGEIDGVLNVAAGDVNQIFD
jgi:putative Mg2+ transporter-C (MgtC) family protein